MRYEIKKGKSPGPAFLLLSDCHLFPLHDVDAVLRVHDALPCQVVDELLSTVGRLSSAVDSWKSVGVFGNFKHLLAEPVDRRSRYAEI